MLMHCALFIPAVHAVCAQAEVCTGIHLCQRIVKVKIDFQSKHKLLFIYFSLLLDEKRESQKMPNPGKQNATFFCHRTIFILPSINNEIALTGNSFLYNVYPVLSRAVEPRGFLSPLKITINCIPHYTLQRLIPHGPQKDEAQVHCLRNHARPVCSAQQRKLICNLQRRQLNLSLLPLKSSSAQSYFICFSGEMKPIF